MNATDASTRHDPDRVVLEDKPCSNCGYNLRGLVMGGNCPECGAVIRAVSRLHEDDLGDAPKGYLAILQLGFVILGTSGLLIAFGLVGSLLIRPVAILAPLGAIGWGVGALIVVKPRPGAGGSPRLVNGKVEWGVLRNFVRSGAIALSLGVIANAVGGAAGIPALQYASLALLAYGFAGVIGLCFYVSNLADWASDSHISLRLISTGIVLAASGLAFSLLFTPLAPVIGILVFPIVFIVLGSGAYMLILILNMSSTISWAQKNAKQRAERDARIAAKARAEAEAANAEFSRTGVSADGDPHLLATIERQNAAAEAESDIHEGREEDEVPQDQRYLGHKIERSGAEEYKLEDD